MWEIIESLLKEIYSDDESEYILKEIKKIYKSLKTKEQKESCFLDNLKNSEIALITYPDSIKKRNGKSFSALREFIEKNNLKESFNILHILPFYIWDTDRGFSIVDYYNICPRYGDWEDIQRFSKDFYLMFDFVFNHSSIKNPMVQGSLICRHIKEDDQRYRKYCKYKDFTIAFSEQDKPREEELSSLARPRPYPVLTHYYIVEKEGEFEAFLGETKEEVVGSGWVWTTFSRKKAEQTCQVDLNIRNAKCFVEIIRILFFYIQNNASLIRFDAIAYLWKKIGKSSIHEKETYIIVEILNRIISMIKQDVLTVCEVNEPQDTILRYLGDECHKGCHLCYQFTHFPLSVYSIMKENGEVYSNWLKSFPNIYGRQFIMVLGSHDGMGLKPVEGILSKKEINIFCKMLSENHKALLNYGYLGKKKRNLYEACATPWSLVNTGEEKEEIALNKYLVVAALGLSIKGIPAIYINGLLATENFYPKKGLDERRTINREMFSFNDLSKELIDPRKRKYKVLNSIKNLISLRKTQKSFSPNSSLKVIDSKNTKLICFKRGKDILAVFNVSSKAQKTEIILEGVKKAEDIASEKLFKVKNNKIQIKLRPFCFFWIKLIF